MREPFFSWGMRVEIFESMSQREHEQVVFCADKVSGLKAIIAIHDTTLGPALGGCRMWKYATEAEAVEDALRLARGMTYKASAAGLNLGGGKAVIIGDPKKDKSELLFRSFGRFVDSLKGRYITAEDVGTSVEDMEWIAMETRFVTGLGEAQGGSGDPSPVTAYGTFCGIQACLDTVFGSSSLKGKTVAIQGIGHVGKELLRLVTEDGGKCVITDIDTMSVNALCDKFKCESVSPKDIYKTPCDVFAPCALGGIINDETLPQFKCKIIAGAANNQLKDEDKHGAILHEKGITYAPDFVINAGGLINVYGELANYDSERALKRVSRLFGTIKGILDLSKKNGIPTYKAANEIARNRIENIRRIQKTYLGPTNPRAHH